MTTRTSRPARRTTGHRVAILLAAAVLVAALVFGAWWVFVRDGREDLTLEAFTGFDGTGHSFVFNDLIESDETVCDEVPNCVESMEGPHVDLYRFSDKETAERFAATVEDAHRSDWIVMVFTDSSLTSLQRQGAIELLDSMWNSE